jgi:hypothetical protein
MRNNKMDFTLSAYKQLISTLQSQVLETNNLSRVVAHNLSG